jgi:hypothetical protein
MGKFTVDVLSVVAKTAGLFGIRPRPCDVQFLEIHVSALSTHRLRLRVYTKQRVLRILPRNLDQKVLAWPHQIERLTVYILQMRIARSGHATIPSRPGTRRRQRRRRRRVGCRRRNRRAGRRTGRRAGREGGRREGRREGRRVGRWGGRREGRREGRRIGRRTGRRSKFAAALTAPDISPTSTITSATTPPSTIIPREIPATADVPRIARRVRACPGCRIREICGP